MAEKKDSQIPDELVDLANRMCDETISGPERERLEQILSEQPDQRRSYLDYLRVHASLIWRYRTGDISDKAKEAGSEANSIGTDPASTSQSQVDRPGWGGLNFMSRWAFFGAVSACVLAAVLLWQRDYSTDSKNELAGSAKSSPGLFVATLREASHAVWSNDGKPVDVGSRVEIGNLWLDAGEAELVFDSGARLLLAGPAKLNLESPLSLFIEQGKVAAHMPPSAVGFQVRTPTSTLVDQGTEFGVLVDPTGSTQVHVFRGQVDVHYDGSSDSGNDQEKIELMGHQARRIDTPGSEGEQIEFSKARFGSLARRVAEPIQWRVSDGGNGHFYQLVVAKNPLTWHEAARRSMNKYFRGMQGHLVTVTSASEDQFVRDNLLVEELATRGVWIGLTDVLRETHFRWITGEPYSYSNWASWPEQQPDDFREADWHGGEDYGMYTRFPEKQPWAWNDLSIDSMHEKITAYIVEYEPTVDALRNRSMTFDPIHWSKEEGGNGHYYRVVLVLEPTDWQTIRELAEDTELLGVPGQLVSLETTEERVYVADNILRICGIPQMMIGLSGSLEQDELRWVNGKQVEGFEVERSHLPTDQIYGVFHWNPAGTWQTGWEIRAMSMDVLPSGWFGYLIEYPVGNGTEATE